MVILKKKKSIVCKRSIKPWGKAAQVGMVSDGSCVMGKRHRLCLIYLFSIHWTAENVSPTPSSLAEVIGLHRDFESVVLLATPGKILMACSEGHMPSLQVIVHCVQCSAVMDSLSMRRPCSLSEHVLNNGFYFSSFAGRTRCWKCQVA